jgi:hypothetical protein
MPIIPGNNEDELDPQTQEILGRYVYALRDPRDRKVFYVGKAGGINGQGNERVFDHFAEARRAIENPHADHYSAKVRRIIEIWAAGEDVEWFIVRHGLGINEEITVLHIEAALIDLLDISQNGPLLNVQRGHRAAQNGLLSRGDVRALTVEPVAGVAEPYLNRPVFIFPIQNAIDRGLDPYAATRGDWAVREDLRGQGAIAVGIVRGLSQGVYQVLNWEPAGRLWRFNGEEINANELHPKNYLGIIARAMGYWQRGNYLVVEFLQNQKFRFLRGSNCRDPQDL